MAEEGISSPWWLMASWGLFPEAISSNLVSSGWKPVQRRSLLEIPANIMKAVVFLGLFTASTAWQLHSRHVRRAFPLRSSTESEAAEDEIVDCFGERRLRAYLTSLRAYLTPGRAVVAGGSTSSAG